MTQFASFFIGINDSQAMDELNRFLRAHRVIRVLDNYLQNMANSGYHILVEYSQGPGMDTADEQKRQRRDWRAELQNETQQLLFDKLKVFRRQLADRDKVKTYMVAKDEHLFSMLTAEGTVDEGFVKNLEHQKDIKLSNYAVEFVEFLKTNAQSELPF